MNLMFTISVTILIITASVTVLLHMSDVRAEINMKTDEKHADIEICVFWRVIGLKLMIIRLTRKIVFADLFVRREKRKVRNSGLLKIRIEKDLLVRYVREIAGRTIIRELEIKVDAGIAGDAAATAILCGAINIFEGGIILLLSGHTGGIEKVNVLTVPNFNGGCIKTNMKCIISLSPADIIYKAIMILVLRRR